MARTRRRARDLVDLDDQVRRQMMLARTAFGIDAGDAAELIGGALRPLTGDLGHSGYADGRVGEEFADAVEIARVVAHVAGEDQALDIAACIAHSVSPFRCQ